MVKRKTLYRFIVYLLVLNLAYVQTVLLAHTGHHTEIRSENHSGSANLEILTSTCDVCDYLLHRKDNLTLPGSVITLQPCLIGEDILFSQIGFSPLSSFKGGIINKGPPSPFS